MAPLLTLLRELTVFTMELVTVLGGMLWDKLYRARGIPRTVGDITPAVLSGLLRRKVVRVGRQKSMEQHMTGEVTDLGAGGTGTTRAWLDLVYEDGEEDRVFVKMPAGRLAERLFLTVFRVYHNELNFYANVRSHPKVPQRLFAECKHVSMKGNSFCLILEDLGKRKAQFPSVVDPYPRSRLTQSLTSFAKLHATFWEAPPQGVWCDRWSRTRTVPATSREMRPPFRQFVALKTLKEVRRRYPEFMKGDIGEAYELLLREFDTVRRYWSSGRLTLVHGDSHVGNMFFTEECAGFYDMQCVAAEHPMRDITYHLLSSYDAGALAREEKDIIKEYLSILAAQGRELTWDEAWLQYRLQSWWALIAFAISAGAGDLMAAGTAILCMGRITTAMKRIGAVSALRELLGRPPSVSR
eukprot:Hpha_TRINITY_DN15471_c5_g3::TRINITY_DN15471_c5_g3_i1::g.176728::m.176728